MAKYTSSNKNQNNPRDEENKVNLFDEFRQDLDKSVDKAIDNYELRMSLIGVVTLLVFIGVIAFVVYI